MTDHRVQVRWQDLDALGHVNHVAVLTFLEEGRDAWLRANGIRREDYVVGRCTVEYRAEIDPRHESVVVHCGIGRLGRSSLTTSERILDDEGRVLVEAQFGIVLWDGERRRPRPITPEERDRLSRSIGV